MPSGDAIAVTVVQLATAGAALCGVWRCRRLQRYGSDRRLTALAWFFGLFAAAVLLNVAWQAQVGVAFEERLGGALVGPGPGNATHGAPPYGFTLFRPEGVERANLWLAGHHALMLASLVVGVWAFGTRRPEAPAVAAAAGFVFIGELVPTMLALEAGVALYLAARAFLNHVAVKSPGALQAALGFLLFFVGHLLFSVAHQPGMGHAAFGDVLNLVGIVLLVQVLPGKR